MNMEEKLTYNQEVDRIRQILTDEIQKKTLKR